MNAVNAATAAGKADLSDLVAAFRKVAEAVSEDVELDAVLHIVGRECCALLDVHRCSVYLKDEEADVYRGRVGEPDPAWDESIKRLTCGTDADRFTQEIVAERRPVLITDAQHDPRPIRSAMRAWDVHSMLGVPMVERGVVTGLIFLDNGDVPHTFSDHQQEVAATFANLAGIAISQARRSAELRTNLATVARQNGLLRRSATIDERLTALVLDAAGLRDIAATVAELTRKPCAIYDAAVLPACGWLAGPGRSCPADARGIEPRSAGGGSSASVPGSQATGDDRADPGGRDSASISAHAGDRRRGALGLLRDDGVPRTIRTARCRRRTPLRCDHRSGVRGPAPIRGRRRTRPRGAAS